jgi:hypothetical protein
VGPTRPELAHLDIGGDPARWSDLGFATADGRVRIGRIDLRFTAGADDGLVGWGLRHVTHPDGHGLDGVPTAVDPEPDDVHPGVHPNGAVVVDHVVMRTPDLDRTLATLAEAGLELRRLREVPDRPIHQAFYRIGEAILEVVGEPDRHDDAPSTLWGLVCTVGDPDVASALAGERLGPWRDAVQPGRRIATVRRDARLTTAVALMTP